jgi:hypothetical protein
MLDGGSCLGGQEHIVAGISAGVGSTKGRDAVRGAPIDTGKEEMWLTAI